MKTVIPMEDQVVSRSRVFNVVVAYEDYATGIRAKEAFEEVICSFGSAFSFKCLLWKFSILENPRLLEIAANDLAAAHLLILSCHGFEQFPPNVKHWLEEGVALRAGASMGVVVMLEDILEKENQQAVAIFDYLQNFADRHGLEFLSHLLDVSATRFQLATRLAGHLEARPTPPALAFTADVPGPRWATGS